jgi:hypothetical protein
MPKFRAAWSFLVLGMLTACEGRKDPCTAFFQPYPDMVSDRFRTEKNAQLLDGMAAYGIGDYATAAERLKLHVENRRDDDAARIYLTCSYLAIGKPYDAELQLDFLEKSTRPGFRDQVDWYNALCWTCSGQYGRALEQCDRILAAKVHTYSADAARLKEALQGR